MTKSHKKGHKRDKKRDKKGKMTEPKRIPTKAKYDLSEQVADRLVEIRNLVFSEAKQKGMSYELIAVLDLTHLALNALRDNGVPAPLMEEIHQTKNSMIRAAGA